MNYDALVQCVKYTNHRVTWELYKEAWHHVKQPDDEDRDDRGVVTSFPKHWTRPFYIIRATVSAPVNTAQTGTPAVT